MSGHCSLWPKVKFVRSHHRATSKSEGLLVPRGTFKYYSTMICQSPIGTAPSKAFIAVLTYSTCFAGCRASHEKSHPLHILPHNPPSVKNLTWRKCHHHLPRIWFPFFFFKPHEKTKTVYTHVGNLMKNNKPSSFLFPHFHSCRHKLS